LLMAQNSGKPFNKWVEKIYKWTELTILGYRYPLTRKTLCQKCNT
jgi:hypothetical protein